MSLTEGRICMKGLVSKYHMGRFETGPAAEMPTKAVWLALDMPGSDGSPVVVDACKGSRSGVSMYSQERINE